MVRRSRPHDDDADRPAGEGKNLAHGGPLIRIKPRDLVSPDIERVPRVGGVHEGLPKLEDGRVLEAANVVWCTGFRSDFSSKDASGRPIG